MLYDETIDRFRPGDRPVPSRRRFLSTGSVQAKISPDEVNYMNDELTID